MSAVVWSAERGWHQGPPVRVVVDGRGRLTTTPQVVGALTGGKS